MAELDKFKRRLIRSVARLMLQEKKSDAELWDLMKKETGCDCQVLWERMRALTAKKLKRHLASDDQIEKIAKIARMSLTDWLLFDLVLVHEKIDLIGKDIMLSNKTDIKAMNNLLELVRMFDIEDLRAEALADAWTGATVHYNSLGYQCSPMLLQRRWYQLKELTRQQFYAFWFKYRGNAKRIPEAKEIMLTPLLAEIARLYPHVITNPFLDWEKLIEQRLVIMPQEFENKMREHMPKRPSNDAEPEVILVEPMVETIDLSDNENHTEQSKTDTPADQTITVKTEPIDLEINEEIEVCDADMFDAMKKTPAKALAATAAIDDVASSDLRIDAEQLPEEESEQNTVGSNDDINIDKIVMPQIGYVFGNVDINDETLSQLDSISQKSSFIPNDVLMCSKDTNISSVDPNKDLNQTLDEASKVSHSLINDSLEINTEIIETSDDMPSSENEAPNTESIECVVLDDSDKETSTENISVSQIDKPESDVSSESKDQDMLEDDIIRIEAKDTSAMETRESESFGILPVDIEFADDGIEFLDDGIAFEESNTDDDIESETEARKTVTDTEESAAKFDLKLLMHPVVDIVKLDNVSIFKHVTLDSSFCANTKTEIDCIEAECKPIRTKIDFTKLSPPKTNNIIAQCVEEIKKDLLNSDPESSDVIPDSQRVKPSSYLLKKPRTRTYDLIKLCKNPDFNTRLKRLSIGFFSSTRNCQLLKCCKPMTIDVHKSFENKLIDGTLYLKKNDAYAIEVNDNNITNEQTSTVVPSAMSVQSLIDCTITKSITTMITNLEKSHDNVMPTERKKVINLPDITEIRRINRNLLTAEVPPIRQHDSNVAQIEPIARDIQLAAPANTNETDNIDCHPAKPSSEMAVNIKLENINPTLPHKKVTTPIIDNNARTSTAIKLKNTIQELQAADEEITKANIALNIPDSPRITKEKAHKEPAPKLPSIRTLMPSRQYELPWKKKPRMLGPLSNDTLLTMDSLAKILNVLANGAAQNMYINVRQTKKKKKRKSALKQKDDTIATENTNVSSKKDKPKENDEVTQLEVTTKSGVPVKPKIRLQYVKSDVPQPKRDFCCWALQQYEQTNIQNAKIEKHLCPPDNCQCCCRSKLLSVPHKDDTSDNNGKRNQLNTPRNSTQRIVYQTNDLCIMTVDSSNSDSCLQCNNSKNLDLHSSEQMCINSDDENKSHNVLEPKRHNVEDFNQHHENEDRVEPDMILDNQQIHNIESIECHNTEVIEQNSTEVIDNAEIVSQVDIPNDCNKDNVHIPSIPNIHVDAVVGQVRVTSGNKSNIMDVQNEIEISTTDYVQPEQNLNSNEIKKNRKRVVYIPAQVSPESVLKTFQPITKHVRYGINKQALPGTSTLTTPQGHIIIDGSQTSPKMRFVQPTVLKRQVRPPVRETKTEKPISLGKNKLLLTTAKLPKKNFKEQFPGAPLGLPQGIKLALQPSGELVVNVDPGTVLSDDDLVSLTKILAAVQQQLQIKPIKPIRANVDVITLSDEENCASGTQQQTPTDETNVVEGLSITFDTQAEVNKEPLTEINNADQTQVLNQSEYNIAEEPPSQIVTAPIEQSLNNKDETETRDRLHSTNTTITHNETEDIPSGSKEVNRNNNTEGKTFCKKTILSDLMAMSGISTEETILTNEDTPENIAPAADTTPAEMPSLLHELTPIVTFSELEYACEAGGLFFKLDLDTKLIVPINVCVKKNSTKKTTTSRPIPHKSVIDLTEDEDICVEETNTSNFEHLTMQKNLKNLEPFKRYKPILSKSLLRDRSLINPENKNNSNIIHTAKKKRKPRRNTKRLTINARINLVDSDGPMEEEYLYDSFGDTATVSDSSDDEPLSKKARRKMMSLRADTLNCKASSPSRSLLKHNYNTVNETGTSLPTYEPTDTHMQTDDVQGQGNENNEDNTVEDCILGV